MSTLATNHGSKNTATLPFQGAYDAEILHREHIMTQFAALPGVKDDVLPHVAQVINQADAVLLNMIEANLAGFTVVGTQLMYNGQPFNVMMLFGAPGTTGAPMQLGNPGNAQPAQLGNNGPQLPAEDLQLLHAAKGWVTSSGLTQTEFVREYGAIFAGMSAMGTVDRRNIRTFIGRLLRHELDFVSGEDGKLELEGLKAVEDLYNALVTQAHGSRSRFTDLKDQAIRLITSGGGFVSKVDHDNAVQRLNDTIALLRRFIKNLGLRKRDVKISTGVTSKVDAIVIAVSGVPGVTTDLSQASLDQLADPDLIVAP